jgi:hypothetical protein
MVRLLKLDCLQIHMNVQLNNRQIRLSNNTMSLYNISRHLFNPNEHGTNICNINGLRMLASDPMPLVIDVGGACANNGRAEAQAAYGVYFGSNLDCSELIPNHHPNARQTTQFAECG